MARTSTEASRDVDQGNIQARLGLKGGVGEGLRGVDVFGPHVWGQTSLCVESKQLHAQRSGEDP